MHADDLASRVRALRDVDANADALVPLGGRLFDVVISAAGQRGHAAVAAVDSAQTYGCGPVIADVRRPWLYWLVPPGTTARWEHHPYGVCVGAPAEIVVPPMVQRRPSGGAYWLRPCRGRLLVSPGLLRRALYTHQPRPTPHRSMREVLGAARD